MRVKICGLCRPEDARLAAACGADYGGVILSSVSPRGQSVAAADRILGAAPTLMRVGVFVDASFDDVSGAARALGLSVLQLHGSEPPALVEALRGAGSWRVWKAIRPRSGAEFATVLDRYAGVVDGVLVDGWSASVAGGGGIAFDWRDVARYRDRIPADTEWIVAGGLTPFNVAGAIGTLGPDTVDVSSGVEVEQGIKSEPRVRAFVESARAAAMAGGAGGQA
jgi:phosphoribosylanthranilate isomerase